MLADNYSARPRHEIARVSELLQSQLLQPINITPVQPQLAESNLLIVDGLGSQSSSFNEFNPLFARNRLALQTSGIYGSNNTWGDEVTQSGLWNNVSYSVGQFHYETDGFRENNRVNQDIQNFFLQLLVTSNINAQFEYRRRYTKFGDIEYNYNLKENFNSSKSTKTQTSTYRAGLKYELATNSTFLLSFIHQENSNKSKDQVTLPVLDPTTGQPFTSDVLTKFLSEGDSFEGQYLFKSKLFNSINGGGYYSSQNKGTERFKVRNFNLYSYNYLRYPESVTWIIGFSFDSIDNDSFSKSFTDINWKTGFIWEITKDTTVRGVAGLTRTPFIVDRGTLQVVQVAGFNQFFDDFNATQSKRYGFAIDHKFNLSHYSGLELSRRELSVPQKNTLIQQKLHENSFKAYINWTPSLRVATKLEYQYEDFDVKKSSDAQETKTHRVPITLSYFSPNGVFSKVNVTYTNQTSYNSATELDNDFYLVNFGLGFRLPKRFGIISFQALNLLDKNFEYQGFSDRTTNNLENSSSLPGIPERTFSIRVKLAI